MSKYTDVLVQEQINTFLLLLSNMLFNNQADLHVKIVLAYIS